MFVFPYIYRNLPKKSSVWTRVTLCALDNLKKIKILNISKFKNVKTKNQNLKIQKLKKMLFGWKKISCILKFQNTHIQK